jgi:hypothetical protein
MGKPSAPDPTATANAQAASNKDTAVANANLNRVDQYSPFGSSTYQVTGKNPDGTPKYTQTTEMSAPIKGIFDSQVANQQHQQDISTTLLNNVASQYSKPIDTSGVNPLNTGMTADQLAELNGKYATSAGPAAQAHTGNYVTTAGNGGGDIQRSLGSMSDIPGVIKGAQDAAYANQMAYLKPQFQNDSSDLQSKLAAQGITQGSAAWDRAQSELSRNQTFQQQQAQNAAFQQGLQGGQTAFGMSLGAGQFANQAQQQGYDQAHSNAELANHAADVTTQNSQFNAGQANAQAQYNAGLNNSAVNSQFGNTTTNAGVNNAAHGQGMTDTYAQYNQPLNTYNQLQTGAQAQQPTFAGVPGANVAPTDVAGIVNNGYANQVGAYNGTMQGLGQLGSTAAMLYFSDKRLKENIEKVGETPSGTNLYSYNYKGDTKPQVGVLAQELRKKQPDAVVKTQSGYLAVDYAKVK